MPATYGALEAVLSEAYRALDGFSPHSVLDCGAGPGTGLWAASSYFPRVESVTAVEPDASMRALGVRLWAEADRLVKPAVIWRGDDIRTARFDEHDMVIASYVLGELGSSIDTAVDGLWDAAGRLLIVIEPGTPDGFGRVRRVRDRIIARGAHAAAPCPHDEACPMSGDNWCHFGVRVARSRRHRQLKGGSAPFEDEKYAYVALARDAASLRPARILRHPAVRPGMIRLDLCTQAGLRVEDVSKRDAAAFRRARKARWGGAWEYPSDENI